MMIKSNFYLLMSALLLMFSCKSTEKDKVVSIQSPEPLLATVEKDNLLGEINGHLITYDYYDDDKLIIYSKKGAQKLPLLTFDFNGYQKNDVSLIYMEKHPFIYIATSHTYGHFCGYFYAVDIEESTTKAVGLVSGGDFKENSAFKGLAFDKYNGLSLDKHNNVISGDYYIDKEGNNYINECLYKLIRIKKNTYKLKLVKSRMNKFE